MSHSRNSDSSEDEGFQTPTEDIPAPPTPITPSSTTFSSFVATPTSATSRRSGMSVLSTSSTYSKENALDDLPYVHEILELFLSSQMVEAERLVKESDPKKERLYCCQAWSLIEAIKALMSFDDKDIAAAIENVRHTSQVAQKHRRPSASLTSRIAGLVISGSGIAFVKSMTPVERHAELIYAETLLIKAVLGIVSSGDWLAFVKEALNMRSALNIYRQLSIFLDAVDKEATDRGEGPEDKSIDQDFRSGVALGMGLNSLVLSLLPGRVITIVELFGYKSDRTAALALLSKPGGWSKDKLEPGISADKEGIRRCVCDMSHIMFHVVINSITFAGVDVKFAERILRWHLQRFPDGVFFLFMLGRLHVSQSQPRLAIAAYERAASIQKEYVQLHHVAYWEEAILRMAMAELDQSARCWRLLVEQSSWSKAVYTYGLAVCLLQRGEKGVGEAEKLFEKVPGLMQRIAGKSIPIEKFAARKARKFKSQGNRLLLPAFELACLLQVFQRMSPDVLCTALLPTVRGELTGLRACRSDPKRWGNGQGFWDDFCLARYMEGVVLRFIAYPDPDAVLDDAYRAPISKEEASAQSLEAFKEVLELGPKIELDHYLVYHCHYDLGRLYAGMGDIPEAKRQLEMVMSGKTLEVNAAGKKGKYSMENALMVRSHAAMEALDTGRGV